MVRRVLVVLTIAALGALDLLGQEDIGDRQLFVTADQCMACHNGLTTPSGEEVSIGFNWRASMMANAARDPYWQGAVRREVMDHPQARAAIEDKCSTCHMPMAHVQALARGHKSEVFSHLPVGKSDELDDRLAADGTSCTICHQITSTGLGTKESYTGGFKIDTSTQMGQRQILGPYDIDDGRTRIMHSASGFQPSKATHLGTSEFCATCHTLYTHAIGPNGEDLGELPEQVPYLEWKHSEYRNTKTCQDCHMQVVEQATPISSVLGEPRAGFSRHAFRGGNFWMPRVFNRYRDELGVEALPQELEAMARQTLQHLETDSSRISITSASVDGNNLEVSLSIENLAGHKLPTAYPSRRVWIRVMVTDSNGESVFESGRFQKDGSIEGNDNDSDPTRYEPHHEFIDDPDDVQIYEVVMVDHQDKVTTGLLSGVRYIKDNRLLPKGFDKGTADPDIAVHGRAALDSDFQSSADQIKYRVDIGAAQGPFTLLAELWYQPIAFRWAANFADYDAPEPQRFLPIYESMSDSTATILARAELSNIFPTSR